MEMRLIADKKPMRKRIYGWTVLLTLFGLLASGVVYRISSVGLLQITGTRISLGKPLNSFPIKIKEWQGIDVSIPVNIQQVLGADDLISRLYVNQADKTWANLYVAYTTNPRIMLGHRPQVCYPASGWIHDSTENINIVTENDRRIPCLIHRFHKTSQYNDIRIVLNYYVVNGQLTDDESVFSGVGWRMPNVSGKIARYVAQIQISSVSESYVRQAAKEMSDILVDFFPDRSVISNEGKQNINK